MSASCRSLWGRALHGEIGRLLALVTAGRRQPTVVLLVRREVADAERAGSTMSAYHRPDQVDMDVIG